MGVLIKSIKNCIREISYALSWLGHWPEILHTKEWKELRRRVFAKYGKKCLACGSKEKITVDHIQPKSKYPELALEFDNLQPLCWPCNKKKSFHTEVDYRKCPI